MNYCLLIPHYNHERQFIAFLPQLIATSLSCVVVDDGSNSQSLTLLREAVAPFKNVHLFEQAQNGGKGAAVKAGIYHAKHLGFSHAIQIDADGQHALADLPAFLQASQQNPKALICGKPRFEKSAPKARVHGRKATNVIVAFETLSLKIKDGLCGYRVYPIAQMEKLMDHFALGNRMGFDTELLVKAVWMNIPLVFLDTLVIYPKQNISHFNYLRDNLLLIRLHIRLILGMFLRSPLLLWRRLSGK
jgi:polyprenyl-phospho-N-acetylgalactosaminyl synthase